MKHSQFQIINADCREAMAAMDADSADSIVCDPPYGLSFMGKGWDHGVPGVEFWQAALRVAKPGAYLLAFGGTRTFHRLMVAIEDAGWEIRDTVMWVYGSGFPKSLDVSKALDKAAGAEREVIGTKAGLPGYSLSQCKNPGGVAMEGNVDGSLRNPEKECAITAPATDAARQWQGWGTALKPAWEPVIVARKPLVGTVAQNVLAWGVGALNIDGCRVSMPQEDRDFILKTARPNSAGQQHSGAVMNRPPNPTVNVHDDGRWPANLVHDGSEEVVGLFPDSSGSGPARHLKRGKRDDGWGMADRPGSLRDAGAGSAARFFYSAKASKADRNEGLTEGTVNNHPTVKPTALMRYLCRLVTPPGGLVLDPFCGSGSTGKAAVLEGFRFVGVEQDSAYAAVAIGRIEAAAETSGDKVAD